MWWWSDGGVNNVGGLYIHIIVACEMQGKRVSMEDATATVLDFYPLSEYE